MGTLTKLGGYIAGLAVVFAVALGAGMIAGPFPAPQDAHQSQDGHAAPAHGASATSGEGR